MHLTLFRLKMHLLHQLRNFRVLLVGLISRCTYLKFTITNMIMVLSCKSLWYVPIMTIPWNTGFRSCSWEGCASWRWWKGHKVWFHSWGNDSRKENLFYCDVYLQFSNLVTICNFNQRNWAWKHESWRAWCLTSFPNPLQGMHDWS